VLESNVPWGRLRLDATSCSRAFGFGPELPIECCKLSLGWMPNRTSHCQRNHPPLLQRVSSFAQVSFRHGRPWSASLTKTLTRRQRTWSGCPRNRAHRSARRSSTDRQMSRVTPIWNHQSMSRTVAKGVTLLALKRIAPCPFLEQRNKQTQATLSLPYAQAEQRRQFGCQAASPGQIEAALQNLGTSSIRQRAQCSNPVDLAAPPGSTT
jgi:hypothetical protein